MVKYTLRVKNQGSNEEYEWAIDLQKDLEDRPEWYFTQGECEIIRGELQRKSSCRINDSQMRRIVATWIEDIKEGYRHSELTLDLPLMSEGDMDNLQESGNQAIPGIIAPDLSEVEPQTGALPPLRLS
ncbi:MAG: hypothetical protein GDA48_10380 [Hormoscilla sp. GM102CHS1]|nr:hypothetical protein [Hormoscilla sp. GM102CHS1]